MVMRYVILLLALLGASCTSTLPSFRPYHLDIQQGNVVSAKMMMQLKPGMTKSQVRYVLGTPLLQDPFHQNRWDYVYQMAKGGQVIERRRIILDFENDSLKALKMPSQETEFKHLDNQYKDEVNALKEHLETLQEQIKDQKRIEEQEKPRKWWELWRK